MDKIGWYIFGVFSGFVGGVILGFVGWSMYFLPKWQEEQAAALESMKQLTADTEAPANVEALTDSAPCPTATAADYVGAWKGEMENVERGISSKWKATHREDGTFSIDFSDAAGEYMHTETGYWAYSGCVFATLTTHIMDQQQLHQELYRVHELNGDYSRYTHYRSGITFESYRIAEP